MPAAPSLRADTHALATVSSPSSGMSHVLCRRRRRPLPPLPLSMLPQKLSLQPFVPL